MGVDLHGYVEVSRWDPERRGDEYAWMAVISVSAVVDACDEVSEFLFGFSKRALSGEKLPCEPLAKGRGVPSNASSEIQEDMRQIRNVEERLGAGEFRGCTYIDYAEIEAADWSRIGVRPELSEWSLRVQAH
jgi:hypothetical protein